MTRDGRAKPILEYASTRRSWREFDVGFWVALMLMGGVLVIDVGLLMYAFLTRD
jgi:hypothetical protein